MLNPRLSGQSCCLKTAGREHVTSLRFAQSSDRIGRVGLQLVVLALQPGLGSDEVVVHKKLMFRIDLDRPVAHVYREEVPLLGNDPGS